MKQDTMVALAAGAAIGATATAFAVRYDFASGQAAHTDAEPSHAIYSVRLSPYRPVSIILDADHFQVSAGSM